MQLAINYVLTKIMSLHMQFFSSFSLYSLDVDRCWDKPMRYIHIMAFYLRWLYLPFLYGGSIILNTCWSEINDKNLIPKRNFIIKLYSNTHAHKHIPERLLTQGKHNEIFLIHFIKETGVKLKIIGNNCNYNDKFGHEKF